MAMNMAGSSGGGGRRRGRRSAVMAEINVTPMVDVMLVLLIIFMVAAPLIQQGVKIALPQTKAVEMNSQEAKLVLSIDAQKRVFLGEAEVPYADLEEKLKANTKLQQDKELYLKADRNLPYGFVVDVLATLQKAGVDNLGMITDPTTPQK